jgi:ribulose-phosphate 3-epimerase
MPELVPAILTNDVSDFRKKHADLLALGNYFSKLHIDFIDGEFLPNKTVMPADLDFLKSPFKLMAHFMAYRPEKYFDTIQRLGFSWALVHYEAFDSVDHALEVVREGNEKGLNMGICINPETPLHNAAKLLTKVDVVQLMGVHPGAQGRTFEPNTIEKIKELKSLTRSVMIAVDGGMKLGLAGKCADAGADLIVIGSAILHASHPKEALEAFKRELELI